MPRGRSIPGIHFFAGLFFAGLLLTLLLPLAVARATEPEAVRLQLKWQHQFQFAGFYAAKELGIYEAAGLDVTILEGGPGKKVQEIVTNRQAEFGVLGSELVFYRSRGADLVVLAPIIQHSIRTIIARKDRGISTPHDLIQKQVMLNTNELPEFAAMFLNEGIRIEDVFVIKKDKTANSRFIAGELDAMNGSMANQPFLFQQANVPVTLIKPVNYGIDFYGDTLFTTASLIRKRPALVAAFLQASLAGWAYTFDNPNTMADLILNKYSNKKSKAHLLFEQDQLRNNTHPDLVEIGYNNPERWRHITETYVRLGLIEPGFSLRGFLYRDYLDKASIWISRLLWVIAVISLLFALNFLWNFRLRRTVQKATREIRESRDQAADLSVFPSENPNPVLRIDPDGRIRYANKGSRALLAFWETGPDGLIPDRWKRRVARVIRNNRLLQFEESLGRIHLSLVITPVQGRDQVNIYGMDITEIYQTRKLLLTSEAKYRELVEGTDDLITSVDAAGHFIFTNRIAEKILGIPKEKCPGMSAFDFIHPDDRERTETWLKGCVDRKAGVSTIENRQVNARSNETFHMLWTSNFHYDENGTFKSVNSVARDVTGRKKLEESLQQALKLEAIGNLAGGVAHDFNNILGIIIGNVELALDDIPDWNPAKQNMDEIRIAGLRARDVVKQLLSFSRKSEQHKKIITLQPIIEESVSLLRASIPSSIEMRINMEDTGAIKADPTQIHQILINLCTNAAHAMDDSGGILGIRLAETRLEETGISHFKDMSPGRYAQLIISDTGHGMDELTRSKIFDPYFTTKEVGKGTGMGLSVVLGIVKSSSGAISVDSEVDRGTTFRILFPLTDTPVDADNETEEIVPGGTETILLVDDETSLLKMGKNQLERFGYRVITKTDPLKALEAFKGNPSWFDLVITDMTMPGMTGDRLAEKILEIAPDTPIILCTGYSSKIDRERARKIGIRTYVEKPFDKQRIARLVRQVIDGNRDA